MTGRAQNGVLVLSFGRTYLRISVTEALTVDGRQKAEHEEQDHTRRFGPTLHPYEEAGTDHILDVLTRCVIERNLIKVVQS